MSSGSFTKQQVIDSILNTKVRLGVSKVPNVGIGVFTIVDLPADTSLWTYRHGDHHISWDEVKEAPMAVQKYMAQMTTCELEEGTFILDVPVDLLYPAYYINHSRTPNVFWDRHTDEMYTITDVPAGAELTTYYRPDERDWE